MEPFIPTNTPLFFSLHCREREREWLYHYLSLDGLFFPSSNFPKLPIDKSYSKVMALAETFIFFPRNFCPPVCLGRNCRVIQNLYFSRLMWREKWPKLKRTIWFDSRQYIANRRLNSKDGRRWSRRVNYGSQLLCEIINFNNLPPPPSPPPPPPPPPPVPANLRDMGQLGRRKRYPLELEKAIRDVQFIRNHMKRRDEYDAVNEIIISSYFYFYLEKTKQMTHTKAPMLCLSFVSIFHLIRLSLGRKLLLLLGPSHTHTHKDPLFFSLR